jgi:hypothetical protein
MTTKKSDTSARVRIAVSDVASELAFDCTSSPAEIKKAVNDALSSGSPLVLTDIRGHEVIVPAAKIGYVEIGEPQERRVGFGA